MFAAYIVVTVLAAVANAFSAALDFGNETNCIWPKSLPGLASGLDRLL